MRFGERSAGIPEEVSFKWRIALSGKSRLRLGFFGGAEEGTLNTSAL